MDSFVALDFETANRERSSVCSIGLVFVEDRHTNPFYCTCRQSRRLFPELPNHRLETVSLHVGYHLADHHHALADAEACAYIALEVFRDLP